MPSSWLCWGGYPSRPPRLHLDTARPRSRTASTPGSSWRLGGSASGVLTDLSNDEWRILDAFEDEQYDLCEVALANYQLGWAYIWPDGDVRAEDWDAAEFEERHLAEYATRCARLAPRLTAGEPKGE